MNFLTLLGEKFVKRGINILVSIGVKIMRLETKDQILQAVKNKEISFHAATKLLSQLAKVQEIKQQLRAA